jgi:hypothetical protein
MSGGGTHFAYHDSPEIAALGLPPGGYTVADWQAGHFNMVLNGAGELRVKLSTSYAWAVYPYAGDIDEGPWDTDHPRLYFGEVDDIKWSANVEDYELGSEVWQSFVGPVEIEGAGGRFKLVPMTGCESIFRNYFAVLEPGHEPGAPVDREPGMRGPDPQYFKNYSWGSYGLQGPMVVALD